MSNRILIKEVDPEAYKVMYGFEKYLSASKLPQKLKDLIKIRTSQLNGCSYCIDQHTKEARRAGETEQRLYALAAWRETPFFTEQERAVLALTEEVTFISNRVSDAVYEGAARFFDKQELSQLIMAIIAMNAWNRIGVSTEMAPSID